ncbi:hypothetical protein [Pelagibius sp.]|uniref:hypothetical protein n=1 Tax=Pelagibius sp. TaxID=1931238 RepID=UPI003BAF7E6D
MPNVKIQVEEATLAEQRHKVLEVLDPLRQLICEKMGVPASACQIVVIPVMGLPDQPVANMDMFYISREGRTRDMVEGACVAFRALLESALDNKVAVRAIGFDQQTYLSLKD